MRKDFNYILHFFDKKSQKIQMGQVKKGVAVLLPGFAIIWLQNQITRQPHLHDLAKIYSLFRNHKIIKKKLCLLNLIKHI